MSSVFHHTPLRLCLFETECNLYAKVYQILKGILLTGTPSPSQAATRVRSISALLCNVIFELSDQPLCWPWSCSSIIFLGIMPQTAVDVYSKSWHVWKGSQGTAPPVHFGDSLISIPVSDESPNADSTSGIILS